MYEATFSVKNLGDGRLIAARMFVVLENLALFDNSTTLRVYRKKVGYNFCSHAFLLSQMNLERN